MFNIVFVRHENSDKNYLFKINNLNTIIKRGDKLLCETMRGNVVGTAVTDSVLIDNIPLGTVIEGIGAYVPLKSIKGKVDISPIENDVAF